jgi:hypothetical protein
MNAKYALLFATALTGLVAASAAASAMPATDLGTAAQQTSDVQKARWVCGPRRCWRQPNYYPGYYGYGFYPGPRYWGPRWRWHRWHHWRRW